jgi:hypothetical protein
LVVEVVASSALWFSDANTRFRLMPQK